MTMVDLNHINYVIDSLKGYVLAKHEEFPPLDTKWSIMPVEEQETHAFHLVEGVLFALKNGEENILYPRLNDWSNVWFHPGYGLLPAVGCERKSIVAKNKLSKLGMVLEIMLELIYSRTRTTKRDIFYQKFCHFDNQVELDKMVSVIVSMIQVPRLLLGIVATSKGLVVGDLKYINSEDVLVDCNLAAGGDTVPQDVTEINQIESNAQVVLVVEKDAVFQRLLEEGIMNGGIPNLLMITGKGVPDLATRQLVYILGTKMCIPVLILTDCDPYGVDISLMYKYGSLAMAWAAEPLAVPTSTWIGLHPSDVERISIPSSSMKAHTLQDSKKMVDLRNRPYVEEYNQLKNELEIMWDLGLKAEIQQVAENRERGFLAHKYIPMKMIEACEISMNQKR